MSYWRLYYHFVWGTKRRLPLIQIECEQQIFSVIAAKVFELEGIVHAIGGIEDHIHVAVSIPPKLALSAFIGQVKGSSSHFVNHVLQPGATFQWQEEYGVLSFSEKSLPFVVRYVKNQHEHHLKGTIFNQLELVG